MSATDKLPRATQASADLFLTGHRSLPSPTPTHTLTAEETARLVGLYRSRQPATVATVARDGDGLRIQYQHGGRLVPTSATRLLAADGRTYEFDGGGRMRAIDEFGTVVLYQRVDPANPSIEQLREFTGSYFSDEVETRFDVQLEGNTLSLRRRPDAPTPLKPVYADAFSFGTAWVIFRRDVSGRVIALSVSGDRMWDLPFTRQSRP